VRSLAVLRSSTRRLLSSCPGLTPGSRCRPRMRHRRWTPGQARQ
jgi:hypothetical protein